MAKQQQPADPYPEYRDGNCRDVSGQIVDCGSPFAVSPPKFPKDHPLASDGDEGDGKE